MITLWTTVSEAVIKMFSLYMVLDRGDDFMGVITNTAIIFSINMLFQELNKIFRIRDGVSTCNKKHHVHLCFFIL